MKLPPGFSAIPDGIWLVLIFLLTVLFTDPAGNFPIGDDWQYGYPVKTWIETGTVEFMGIFAPNILLQVWWGFLFCKLGGSFDFTWLRFSTLTTSIMGIIIFYDILRKIGTPHKTAFYFSLVLMFNPLFYYLSFTFFTDVPFLLFFIWAVFYFFKHLKTNRTSALAWAAICAAAGFYIRQPGLLLIPSFGIFILLKNTFSKKSIYTAFALFVLTFGIYFSLEKYVKPALSIADNFVPVSAQFYNALIETPFFTGIEWIKKGIKTFVYLGFFTLPFFPFIWNNRKEINFFTRPNTIVLFAVNIALFLLMLSAGKTFPFGGNILFNFGLGSELLADVYTYGLPNVPRAPEWIMLALQFISQLNASFLFILIIKNYKHLAPLQKEAIVFLLIFNLIYLPVMSITSFFDRYLLPTIVSFFIIISFFTQLALPVRKTWKLLPFVLICGFSIFATRDFMAWNTAKNQAFRYLTDQGISIREMDAGYEYNGLYNYHFPKETTDDHSFWWVTDDKYLITFGPVSGYRAIASFPYYRLLSLQQDAILVLQRTE